MPAASRTGSASGVMAAFAPSAIEPGAHPGGVAGVDLRLHRGGDEHVGFELEELGGADDVAGAAVGHTPAVLDVGDEPGDVQALGAVHAGPAVGDGDDAQPRLGEAPSARRAHRSEALDRDRRAHRVDAEVGE